MRSRRLASLGLRAVALCATLALIAGCGSGGDKSSSSTVDSSSAAAAAKPIKTSWGTFKLKQSIVDKVAAGEPINYAMSYSGAGVPLLSDQFNSGFKLGEEAAKSIYPLDATMLSLVQPDPNRQLAAIQAKVSAGQIDCLSVLPDSPTALNSLVAQMMDQGIPVFTIGVPTTGHELTNFTQVPDKEGAQAARTVLDWMKANGKDLTTFAVSTGNPTQPYSIGRVGSFVKTIKAAIPDARFVTSEDNPLNMTYDPAAAYDKVKAFLSAHPEVQVLENVDIGAEIANKAIHDLGLDGKVFTVGWNVTQGQADAIERGTQIAVMDQRWIDQAAFGAKACATLIKSGEVLPNTQVLKPYTKDNISEALQALRSAQ